MQISIPPRSSDLKIQSKPRESIPNGVLYTQNVRELIDLRSNQQCLFASGEHPDESESGVAMSPSKAVEQNKMSRIRLRLDLPKRMSKTDLVEFQIEKFSPSTFNHGLF